MPRAASFLLCIATACAGSGAPGSPDAAEPSRADARRDDPGGTDAAGGAADAAPAGRTVASCFDGVFANPIPADRSIDYDQFHPVVGSHCLGTDQQAITGVERVVFLGDSVTVGSPPTTAGQFYRSRLAERLADRFGLEPPGALWEQANPLSGTSTVQDSGDFASCAKWGARTDDLMQDNSQVLDCFPESERGKRTLVVMTVGGNDVSSITKAGLDGAALPALWDQTHQFVQYLRDTITWIKAPGRFPAGVFVVFANMYEFTDGTGETTACPAASLAGFGGDWDDPDALAEMVIWANEQYMSIAVDTGSDMIFSLENFCGHGYKADDPTAPCYRGPGSERWFDDTCIHPNPTGHGVLADMFMAVVDE